MTETKEMKRLDALFDELVPAEGKADSLARELIGARRSTTASSTTETRLASGTGGKRAIPRPGS